MNKRQGFEPATFPRANTKHQRREKLPEGQQVALSLVVYKDGLEHIRSRTGRQSLAHWQREGGERGPREGRERSGREKRGGRERAEKGTGRQLGGTRDHGKVTEAERGEPTGNKGHCGGREWRDGGMEREEGCEDVTGNETSRVEMATVTEGDAGTKKGSCDGEMRGWRGGSATDVWGRRESVSH